MRLARAAADIGAEFMQVSPPFYFAHTDDDFMEHVAAAAAASDVGMVVYNTHWTSLEISNSLIDRLATLGTVVGLPSSRSRPPTRDIRDLYRERARAMLQTIGAPNVLEGD